MRRGKEKDAYSGKFIMDEGRELEDFLKKRGLQQDLLEKIQEQKFDCQTLCAMPDSQLQMYIPKLGDVYAIKRFCQELFSKQQKYNRKTTLLEKFRRKLRSKYNKHDVCDEEESSDQRRANLLGNANASKNERKIELGWCDFNICSEKYQQIRNKNGGGTWEAKVNKYWKAEDILQYLKGLFFPGGVSKKGHKSKFEFHLKDFQQSAVDDSATVEDLYKITQMRILRLYVYTRRKQPVVIVEASDKCLLEGNFSGLITHVGKSVLGLDFPSASASVNPEGHVPTTYTALCATPTALNDLTPSSTMQSSDSDMQSSLLTVQVENEIKFSLYAESYKLLSSEESPSVSCNSLPRTATSEAGTLCMDEMDYIVVFESVSSESVNTLSPETPAPQTNTFQTTQEQEKPPSTLKIHQGNCFTELIKLYQKKEMFLRSCTVKGVLPNGEDEKGEGVGLLRDIFTEFWESFFSKCCESADIKVPILRHDMGEYE